MRAIRTSYTTVTPESAEAGDFAECGMLDEVGTPMEPDDDDTEDGLSASDVAIRFLQNRGACNPSSSGFHVGVWYSDEGDTDFRTGEEETHSYHLVGFTPEEERAIYEGMRA